MSEPTHLLPIRMFSVQNILFNGLIIGPTYEFTYNSQIGAKREHEFFFNGLADFSGNIIGLIQGADYHQGQ
ncbi:MAG: hypothetical protein KL787_07605 [Taibaiella sp.]|nr:hypothetical protein [Taibaiella sp.]